jgi:hypothetical protein
LKALSSASVAWSASTLYAASTKRACCSAGVSFFVFSFKCCRPANRLLATRKDHQPKSKLPSGASIARSIALPYPGLAFHLKAMVTAPNVARTFRLLHIHESDIESLYPHGGHQSGTVASLAYIRILKPAFRQTRAPSARCGMGRPRHAFTRTSGLSGGNCPGIEKSAASTSSILNTVPRNFFQYASGAGGRSTKGTLL